MARVGAVLKRIRSDSAIVAGALLAAWCLSAPARIESRDTSNRLGCASLPADGTAAVSGVVIDGVTKAPIGGALIEISAVSAGGGNVPGSAVRQLSDPKGRFAFTELPVGAVSLRARKLGFLDVGSQAGPMLSPRRFSLRDGEWISDIVMPLWRPGAIGGTVRDERGDAVVDVWVRVLMKLRVLGHERFVARRLVRTDDRGRYRVGGLAPGQYVVQVPSLHASAPQTVQQTAQESARWTPGRHFPVPPPPVDGRPLTYPAMFSPGVRSLDLAAPVDLALGERRENVDITLEPVPAFRLSGAVIGPQDALEGLMLRLIPEGAEGLGRAADAATAIIGGSGRFTLFNVPAGAYTLHASHAVSQLTLRAAAADLRELEFSMPTHDSSAAVIMRDVDAGPAGLRAEVSTFGGSSGYWARQSIVLGNDETNITVPVRETGTMRGRIRKELAPGWPVPAIEPAADVELDPADASPQLNLPRSHGRPHEPTGHFTISGVLPGKYFLRVKHGWIARSISWSGRDYTDSPFDATETQTFSGVDVVVTNAGAGLSGTVIDEGGASVDNAVVMLFPATAALGTDFGLWPARIRSAVPGGNGSYEIAGVPAGDYHVIAVSDSFGRVGPDPEFFKLAQGRARRVSLEWARTTKLDLLVSRTVH